MTKPGMIMTRPTSPSIITGTRNQNQTPEESLDELEAIGTLAYKAGLDVVAYISMAFGNPYGEHTGAPWRSTTHIDVVGLGFNIWLETDDGEEQIMRDGKFLIAA